MTSPDQRIEVGRRVRKLRERSGKSRAALGGLVGRSEAWLKAIEKGKRGLPLQMAMKLARELKVGELADIYGADLTAPVNPVAAPALPDAEAIGEALTRYSHGTGASVSVPHLRAALDSAWRDWHATAAQRSVAAAALPALITAGRAAVATNSGETRRKAQAALADVYHLSQACLAWVPNASHWYWIAVDRGLSVAEDADHPVTRATGLMYYAIALRSSGRADEASDLLRRAVQLLDPLLADADVHVRALWGDLQLATASTAARFRGDPSAWTYVTKADQMAARLPDGFLARHGFSRSHVGLHRTWVATSLGSSSEALRHSRSIDANTIPSRVWRASHLINVASALRQQRDNAALDPLLQAEAVSAQTVQFSGSAREIIADLAFAKQNPARSAAYGLAQRLQLDV